MRERERERDQGLLGTGIEDKSLRIKEFSGCKQKGEENVGNMHLEQASHMEHPFSPVGHCPLCRA